MIPRGTWVVVRWPRGDATADVQGEVKRSDNKDERQVKTWLTSAARYLIAEGLLLCWSGSSTTAET
ncbi:unnamed protein product, partial [Bubo scandiacus]